MVKHARQPTVRNYKYKRSVEPAQKACNTTSVPEDPAHLIPITPKRPRSHAVVVIILEAPSSALQLLPARRSSARKITGPSFAPARRNDIHSSTSLSSPVVSGVRDREIEPRLRIAKAAKAQQSADHHRLSQPRLRPSHRQQTHLGSSHRATKSSLCTESE